MAPPAPSPAPLVPMDPTAIRHAIVSMAVCVPDLVSVDVLLATPGPSVRPSAPKTPGDPAVPSGAAVATMPSATQLQASVNVD